MIILYDVGGGAPSAWYETRGTVRCFSFPIVLPVPENPPPSRLAGTLTHTVSTTIDIPQPRGRVDTTVVGPIRYPGLAASALFCPYLVVYEIYSRVLWVFAGVCLGRL